MRPAIIKSPFATPEEVAQSFGVSKTRLNRLLRLAKKAATQQAATQQGQTSQRKAVVQAFTQGRNPHARAR